jgi:transposase
MTFSVYLGVDTSKAHLDVGTVERAVKRFSNDSTGHQQLLEHCVSCGRDQVIVGVESTGSYSQALVLFLAEHGIAVALIQPNRVRHFARSQGLLAKTDAIDARMIAQYCAATRNLRLYTPPSESQRRLRALVDRRDQLVNDRQREQCRREACLDRAIATELKQSIDRLARAIAKLDQRIQAAIAKDAHAQSLSQALQDVTGVGPQTAVCLLAHLPELGCVNRQEIAALAGLAPYNCDSGNQRGKRATYGGRARVKRALFMAALSAARFDEHLNAFYLHLLRQGKAKKVALTACARKLVIRLNSIVAQLNGNQSSVA